ncbi:MAG TPA: hypothetical protein VMX13_11530 [Sedimentisphaerales bacterium]|nr:hypothetical protein [Sedimentisphaerales bacterium]
MYHVTNLNDSGSGSLRYGIQNTPPEGRTIVFDISGNIELTSTLKVEKNKITIAGQTAPAGGICVRDGRTNINADDIIIRHLRFRPSESGGDGDALHLGGGNSIMIDHCSASWASDEVLSAKDLIQNLTVQWTYIYEGLNLSFHYEDGVLLEHSMGSLLSTTINNAVFSFHHNLYAHNRTRNPKPTAGEPNITLQFDFRNNVVYDWGNKAGYSSDDPLHPLQMNYVANYLVAGPSTKDNKCYEAFDGMTPTAQIYQSGNRIDGNRNGQHDGADTGWAMFSGPYTQAFDPFPLPAVTTDAADAAYEKVLAEGGAVWWNRDAADARVASDVVNETGSIIDWPEEVGGWPALNTYNVLMDTDADGMPDNWELVKGLDPNDPDDRNGDRDGDGYTNLEEYLNELCCQVKGDFDHNGDVNWNDLRTFVGTWLNGCSSSQWCNNCDIDRSGRVDLRDFALVANSWVENVP